MSTIVIQKAYHNQKQDKHGKTYDLVNLITAKGRYTIFDYSGDTTGLADGDSLDISGYEQQENYYNGKTSIVLSKPRTKTQPQNTALEARVAALEAALQKFREWAEKVEAKINS